MSLPNSTRLGSQTWGEILKNMQTQLKEYTSEVVPPATWLKIGNEAVWEYNELAGNKDAELYKESIELVVSEDDAGVSGANADGIANANVAYTDSTKVVKLGLAGVGTSGVTWMGPDGFDSTWVGSKVIIQKLDGSANAIMETRVAAVGSQVVTHNVTLRDAYGSNMTNLQMIIIIIKAYTIADGLINLGAEEGLIQRIDRITSLENSYVGLCLEKNEKELLGIMKPNDNNSEFADDIVWYRKGDYLRVGHGANISTDGDFDLNYTRKPIAMTSRDSIIDVVDGASRTIKDMIMIKVLQITKQPIPSQYANSEAGKLLKIKQNNAEEKATIKNKQGD